MSGILVMAAESTLDFTALLGLVAAGVILYWLLNLGTINRRGDTAKGLKRQQNLSASASSTLRDPQRHHYGSSYIVIFKLINLIAAIIVGYVLAMVLERVLLDEGTADLIGVIGAIIWWFIGGFGIKWFENVKIIAENSDKLVNLYREQQVHERQSNTGDSLQNQGEDQSDDN